MKAIGIEEKNIYVDKESGKDFTRIGYQYMLRALDAGDVLVIKSIDRLGRNYRALIKEWSTITQGIKADIRVLDMPLLDTTQNKTLLGTLISDIVLQLLSYVAEQERENIRQRQSEGIALTIASGKPYGRPRANYPTNWLPVYTQWRNGSITAVKAFQLTGLSKVTFYNLVHRYEGK